MHVLIVDRYCNSGMAKDMDTLLTKNKDLEY
jgi:hypothetical protein